MKFKIDWRLFAEDAITGEFLHQLCYGTVIGYPELCINFAGALIVYLEQLEPRVGVNMVFETIDSAGNKTTITDRGQGSVTADFGRNDADLDFSGMEDDPDDPAWDSPTADEWEDEQQSEEIDTESFPF